MRQAAVKCLEKRIAQLKRIQKKEEKAMEEAEMTSDLLGGQEMVDDCQKEIEELIEAIQMLIKYPKD